MALRNVPDNPAGHHQVICHLLDGRREKLNFPLFAVTAVQLRTMTGQIADRTNFRMRVLDGSADACDMSNHFPHRIPALHKRRSGMIALLPFQRITVFFRGQGLVQHEKFQFTQRMKLQTAGVFQLLHRIPENVIRSEWRRIAFSIQEPADKTQGIVFEWIQEGGPVFRYHVEVRNRCIHHAFEQGRTVYPFPISQQRVRLPGGLNRYPQCLQFPVQSCIVKVHKFNAKLGHDPDQVRPVKRAPLLVQ